MSELVQKLIIRSLLKDDEFARKALPNMRAEYFQSGEPERVAFELIDSYIKKYVKLPTPEALVIDLSNRTDLSQELFDQSRDLLSAVVTDDTPVDQKWALDQAEQFCQDRAIHLALSRSLEILRDKGEKGLSKGTIPKLMQDALAVTFNPHIGHDYFMNSKDRYAFYTRTEKKVPFDLKAFNEITRGGWSPKTLNVVMAVSGAGKSLFMCHCAADNLMQGKNVLYVTLELSEEMVGQRIDSNLMGVDMGLLATLPPSIYKKKIEDLRKKTPGNLIVQEYSAASAANIRHLLSELRIKKSFVPDIIYVDYLNLCTPAGRKGEMNSYERVKCVAEELRAIAVDFNVPLVSATQTNRTGYNTTGVGMENVSDSLGLPMTCDLFFALIDSEQLKEQGKYKVLQLKSRYDDIGKRPYFYVRVNRSQMKLMDDNDRGEERVDTVGDYGGEPDFSHLH